ncbi:hypothetical protein TCAL_14813 [Tigriopus californicus]|uniref:Granulins domain-containing protein n=2 Tax=Tigriopus californicus TaxID=6832 RepID=A0A553PPI5_TIGCA|nr:hypothetical protein TCAL_14813 [Tigriopus californicus]
MKLLLALICLSLGIHSAHIDIPNHGHLSTQLKQLRVSTKCAGTECPGGCCPEMNWSCCLDDAHCAQNNSLCVQVHPLLRKLKSRTSSRQCDGTPCPGGCCPEVGWVCCEDGLSCASSPDKCEVKTASHSSCTGTKCQGGCCNEKNWFCCQDQRTCASSADRCIGFPEAKPVLVTKSRQCDEGTACPGGCCGESGWVCCENDVYCAPSADFCPPVDVTPMKKYGDLMEPRKPCEGLICPLGSCCPHEGWVCCPDGLNCALEESLCPSQSLL